MMPILSYCGVTPRIGERVFLAPSAYVVGDVSLEDDTSLWFNTLARGDVNSMRIGDRTNIQDGSVLHVTHERFSWEIGSEVVVGHGAILHGCRADDGALIGIGARVLDGAVVEEESQVGAGALVAPGERIPAGHLALGIPANVVRPLDDDGRCEIRRISRRYLDVKESYRREIGDGLRAEV